MSDPEWLLPGETRQKVTERVAATFAELAQGFGWRNRTGSGDWGKRAEFWKTSARMDYGGESNPAKDRAGKGS